MKPNAAGLPDADVFSDPLPATARRQLAGRLAGLSLPWQVAVLAGWPLLEQVLNFLVTFVDTAQAGHLNADSVAAVGVAGYLVWGIGMIQAAVGIGSTAILARTISRGRRRFAEATVGQALLMAAFAGVVMGAVLFVLASPISQFIELTGRSLSYSILFLRILALATPLSFVLFVGCACLRSAGETVTPFWIMLGVNIVNLVANCAFVLAPAPLGGHGVAGIAAATDLAWGFGALLMVVSLLRGRHGVRLRPKRLVPRWHLVQRIGRIGLPNLAEASGFWGVQFLILKIIGHIGRVGLPSAMGIHSVAARVVAISYLPGFAMSVAAATLAGQYLGVADPQRAKQAVRFCWYVCMGIMGTMGLLFVLIPRQLLALVTNDSAILHAAPTLLRICGPSEIFLGTYLVLSQAMRGAGDTRAPLVLSYVSIFCLRLPAAYILGLVLHGKLVGVWFALCGEVVFRGVIFALYFRQCRWVKAKV